LTFQDARLKLLAYVRDQVRNGEITERGLARLIGISQPHVHNVLKGTRSLSMEMGDLLLRFLRLSLLDFAEQGEFEAQIRRRQPPPRVSEVPFLRGVIGPGNRWPAEIDPRRNFLLQFPAGMGSAEIIAAEISPDPSMTATLDAYQVAILDISPAGRSSISPQGLYALERGGEAVLRYIRSGSRSHYLVSDADLNQPWNWERLSAELFQIREIVRGRVVWLGNLTDEGQSAQRGRLLYEPTSS
jgi:transcriptional regulator with XRE-family HTH domain